ncbi:MAG: hypothetical protein QM739_10210 [Propionivibrio sp.]
MFDLDRHRQHGALQLAVFRHEANALTHGIGRMRHAQRLAALEDFARRLAGDAEHALRDLGAAGADEAGKADDFALAHFNIDVFEQAGAIEMLDLEMDVVLWRQLLRKERGHFAADHHGDDVVLDAGLRVQVADRLAVLDDGDVVGDAEEFLQTVRDVEDGDAAFLQARQVFEQHVHFRVGEHGGRLVEDQHAHVARQRLGDFDHLLVGDAEVAGARARVDVVAERLQQFAGFLVQCLPVDERTPLTEVFQENVLGHRQVRRQRQLLVHDADAAFLALLRRGEVLLFTEDFHASGILDIDAGKDLHQRRLTGAVFADDRVYRPRVRRKIDTPESLDAAEALLDPLNAYRLNCHANPLFHAMNRGGQGSSARHSSRDVYADIEAFVTPAKAGVQFVESSGFRLSPE